MSGQDLWINSKYPTASSRVTFAEWLPCLTSAQRPWVTERSTAGGPGLSLAWWELREAWLLAETFWRSTSLCGFLLWGLISQLSWQLLSKKNGSICAASVECERRLQKPQESDVTESQNGGGWKGPLWVI